MERVCAGLGPGFEQGASEAAEVADVFAAAVCTAEVGCCLAGAAEDFSL
jgi:hypothetical protein